MQYEEKQVETATRTSRSHVANLLAYSPNAILTRVCPAQLGYLCLLQCVPFYFHFQRKTLNPQSTAVTAKKTKGGVLLKDL